MVAKSVKWALASLVLFPSAAAFALGLGDVRLLSQLNAPLEAEIEVLGATPEEMASLKAQIASRELFAEKGLDFPPALASVTLTPMRTSDGREVIRIRSREAVTEPFLTMLVEVNSLRSRLVREYTMLLDPPVYSPDMQQANAPIAAPSTADSARGGQIARIPAVPAQEPSRAQTPASPIGAGEAPSSTASSFPTSTAAGTDRTVRSGETLSGIASEVSTGGTAESRAWMLAIYQNNPAAFDGNMNVMRSGAVLRIPDSSVAAAISSSEANAEIRRQWTAWRSGPGAASSAASDSEPGRLRLVTPAEPGAAGTDSATSAQNTQLQGRVRELEAQVEEAKRLLELKNAEVAQLQARLSTQPQPSAVTPPPVEQPAATAEPPAPAAETPPPAEEPVAQASDPALAASEPTPQAEAPPAEEPKPAATAEPAPAQGGSIIDTLTEYWWVGGALVIALLAFFGLRAFRSRQRNDFDDSLSRLAASSAGAAALDRGDSFASDTQPVRGGPGLGREAAFVVEESGTHERPRFGGDLGAAPAPRNVATADETISSETAINLDQGDPLAEADFHMAYGLYDQAADLVRIAISREPTRRDLKLKLLEVFFVWGNKEQFLQTARELADTRDRAQSGEWEKIVIMGKQLAPEDPLFAGSGGGSASLGGVDLDLEGGQSRVDFDLLGEPVAAGAGDGIDLDIGSALGEGAESATVTDANLALHEDGFTSGTGTQTTRQMTQKIRNDEPTVATTYGADFEAPTVEQPQLYNRGDNPTVRQKVETAMKHGGAPNVAEQTAELAIDDLGLDLSSLDTMDQPAINSTQEAPTLVAGLDERSRRIMDEAERRGGMRDPDATAISATGSWNLAGDDLDPTMSPERVGYENGADERDELSETSRLKAVKGKDLDFDFSDAEEPAVRMTNGSGVDLDVGTATVPDTAFTSTQKLSSEDLALPDLEPVTMSEVGTKLDLARAYMDMGDPEGARNILEEVMQEGSVAQKQEAQRLIESLPG
jgi:pilus assembly protein FimV